jgi:hypothetical protein
MVFTWLSDAITIVCASTGSITNGYNYKTLNHCNTGLYPLLTLLS